MAIEGVGCLGKTTSILQWDDKKLLDDRWTIRAKFLDYLHLRRIYAEFIDKQEDPFMELAYSLTHLLRTFDNKPASQNSKLSDEPETMNQLWLVDRTCIANLVYYLLFFFKGETDFENLYGVFTAYDSNKPTLPIKMRKTIERVEKAIKIVGQELARLDYHIIMAIPNNPFRLVDQIKKRQDFDIAFATLDYVRSQTFLFKRFARLMPKSLISIMRVDDFFELDEYQLKNHLQSNQSFH